MSANTNSSAVKIAQRIDGTHISRDRGRQCNGSFGGTSATKVGLISC